ncbi:MAG: transcriptional repressor, partial [Burkholderiaceae bacterium]|nr:transcriptional repressor [Burkholderiaceae bacterium]
MMKSNPVSTRQSSAAALGAAAAPAPAPAADCVRDRLRQAGIALTVQRLALGALLFGRPQHITAEQLLTAARAQALSVSRATVYNTLRLFVTHGLLRELVIEGAETVYDSNTATHHHFYDVATGEVFDIDAAALQINGLQTLADALTIEGVDVVVRGRR